MTDKFMPGRGSYDDMLDLPHPVSKKHPPMSLDKRAAQFAPFAALTGFEGAIEKAGLLFEEEADRGNAEYLEFEDI